MRARTVLTLCCFFALLVTGSALFAAPAPALAAPTLDSVTTAPVCSAPVARATETDLGDGPVTEASCPASVWQACYQRHGTCALCFCLGSACECENRCV